MGRLKMQKLFNARSAEGRKWSFIPFVTFMSMTLVLSMGIVFASPVSAPIIPEASSVDPLNVNDLILKVTEPVTFGAVKKTFEFSGATVHVIEVDLNNPYIDVQALSPQGQIATRATISTQAKQTDAVAAMNADFFNTKGEGAPLGIMMRQGALISSPVKLNAIYSLGITAGRTARIEQFGFSGSVTSTLGNSFPLSGINKTPYYEEPSGIHSHVNQLHLYTEHWARTVRGHDTLTTPTEVLLIGGVVQSVHLKAYYPGAVPPGATILRAHGTAAKFIEANAVVGEPLAIDYRIVPEEQWLTIIGGHSLLVDQGVPVIYARSLSSIGSQVARSAVGISQDGKTVYMIAVEKKANQSKGLTIKQLSEILPKLGIWKGLNLDGGGSTTMVSRPLGDFEVAPVLTPQEGSERSVVNGISLHSTAPQGTVAGGVMSGPKEGLVGQPIQFVIKAYDQYYNPVDSSTYPIAWSVPGEVGSMTNGIFVGTKVGDVTVQAQMDGTMLSAPVKLVDRDQIVQVKIEDVGNANGFLSAQQRALVIRVKTDSGYEFEAPSSSFNWTFDGIDGTVVDNVLSIHSMAGNTGSVTASYRGFKSTLAIFTTGESTLLSMKNLKRIIFEKTPTTVLGFVDVVADPVDSVNTVVRLSYDFSMSSGTQVGYLTFPDGGVALPNHTEKMAIDVFGLQGGEWLRAEIVDGKGNLQRLTLAQKVDWNGWNRLSIPLSNLSGPLKLKRLYAVGLESDWKLLSDKGHLLFKNLSVTAPVAMVADSSKIEALTLQVGNRNMLQGKVATKMDTAPVTVEGRTLVPLRFISEALGAKVSWQQDTKNAAIWKGNQWVDLWFGAKYMVRAGRRIELDVPPLLVAGRLMIPLRAVAESLDLKVTWDGTVKQIILQ